MSDLKTAVIFSLLSIGVFVPTLSSLENVKVCLTMIVRNEEKIIERCLEKVKNNIDCLSICDTGSTDGTIFLIEQFMKKHHIPGRIYQHEWKNFAHNRTLSYECSKQTLQDLEFSLQNSYLLLLDADMILQVSPDFNRNTLDKDAYIICQKTAMHAYYNTRLIRASLPWICEGVTHEYWRCKTPVVESRLDLLTIDDINDGGCKSDKFERDIKLLTAGLAEEPQNERYLFYLAQSYKCLNKFEEAIPLYKARIEKGGWKEEVWYAKYMVGECYESLGLWEQALAYYLEAYQFNPSRAETLQQIAKHYRLNKQNDLAYLFAKQAASIPYPKEEVLFISHAVYDYLLDEDISIAAYYTPYKEEGFAAINRLLLKKNIPYHIKEKAYENLLFYIEKLKNAEYRPVKIDLPLIREGLTARYSPMNPSIQRTKEGYHLICRTVNYTQIGAKHFKSLDLFDPTLRTRNFFIKLDRAFNVISQHEIVEALPREKNVHVCVQGLEDCRLFEFENSDWFTCTTRDTNLEDIPQVSLCKLSDHSMQSTVAVEKLIPLNRPIVGRCEKNWLPFITKNALHLIYSYQPLTIYKLDLKHQNYLIDPINFTHNKMQSLDLSRFSGSASPIDYKEGFLLLVHEVIHKENRIYIHRFLYLDRDFNIIKISKPFNFLHHGIEYCCGMTIDHSGKKLVFTIGLEDREAYIGFVNLDTVDGLLEEVSSKIPGPSAAIVLHNELVSFNALK